MSDQGISQIDVINLGIGLFGVVLAIVGTYLSWRAIKDAREQAIAAAAAADGFRDGLQTINAVTVRLQDQEDSHARQAQAAAQSAEQELASLKLLTQSITSTIQTRAIGHFPENLRAIIDLVGRAKSSLVIACDVAAYGQLSNSEECQHYFAALVDRAARGVDVQMIAYSGARADAERRLQFATYVADGATGLERLTQELRWQRFASRNKLAPVSSFDQLFQSLLLADLLFRRDLSSTGGVPLYELGDANRSLPAFFWLRDNEEAIFSLFTVGEKSREISFRTIDQSITDILQATFQSLRQSGTSVHGAHFELAPFRHLLAA